MTKTCGIHITFTRPCRHCARAHEANAAALADVHQRPAAADKDWKRMTPNHVEARVHELHAAGETKVGIARTLGISAATVSRIVDHRPKEARAPRFAPDQNVKRAHDRMWSKSSTAQRDANRTKPLPRNVHV